MPDIIETITHSCGCTVAYETPADYPLRGTTEQTAQRRCLDCDGSQSQYPDPFSADPKLAAAGKHGLSPDDVDEIELGLLCDFYGYSRLAFGQHNAVMNASIGYHDNKGQAR